MSGNTYQCCFCGGAIVSNDTDVTSLIVVTNWDKEENQEQQFFCHLACFKDKVAENVPLYLP